MCSWILAVLPGMSPTVALICARAMRRGGVDTLRLWLHAASEPVLDETLQRGVGRTLHRQQVAPGRGDHALRARPPGEHDRLAGPGHRGVVGARDALLEPAQGPALAGAVEEQHDVALLERLQD